VLGLGVGRHPAEQCSAVESSKSRGPVVDLNVSKVELFFNLLDPFLAVTVLFKSLIPG